MIDYVIHGKENLLYCNISGEVRALDFQNYVQDLLRDKDFHLELDAIIRIGGDLVVSYANEAAGIGKVFSELLNQRTGILWAFITPNQITKSIVNLIMQEIDPAPISVAYFESEEEAKSWISAN